LLLKTFNACLKSGIKTRWYIEPEEQLMTIVTQNGQTMLGRWAGGAGIVYAQGTFGGGTLKLLFSLEENGTYDELDGDGDGLSFTQNGGGRFYAPNGWLKLDLAGATNPSIKVETCKYLIY
jgi:hypothetical protein